LHGPSHWGFWPKLETLCEALAQAYQTGKCKTIGTCNLNLEQVRYVYTYMRKVSIGKHFLLKLDGWPKQRDIPFVSNQVEFSLVRMDPLTTGLIEGCRKLGVRCSLLGGLCILMQARSQPSRTHQLLSAALQASTRNRTFPVATATSDTSTGRS
jgi:aryl-alcohol dehydrogenase-like predicted oxidoreductase